MCVSFSLEKHGMTDVYKKATVGIKVRDRRGFAGSPGRKWYFLRCLGVFAHCECRLAGRCWCRYGLCSPAPNSCLLGLRPFTWPAEARHRRFRTPSGQKCAPEGVKSGTTTPPPAPPPPQCCGCYQHLRILAWRHPTLSAVSRTAHRVNT